MGDTTSIDWTDSTFNAWMGCTKVSAGCQHCYAESFVRGRMGKQLWGQDSPRQVTSEANWRKPLAWNRAAQRSSQRRRVFCGSLMDSADDHPTAEATRPPLWDLILRTPWLDWQLLTKRAERISACLPDEWGDGYPNVWLGVTVEDDAYAWRATELARIPAVVRFVSYEPAIGPVPSLELTGIDWLICGGESGPGYRAFDPQWARDAEAICRQQGVAFFFKQAGGPRSGMGAELDGRVVQEFPMPRVRELVEEK